MALQLTLSCDSDKTETGPILIHSTGVEHYKIPPEVIRILQDSLTNEFLSDHEDGVLCQADSQRVLDILLQHGFTLQNQSDDDGKTTWIVEKANDNDGNHSVEPDQVDPADNAENENDAGGNEEQEGAGGEENENAGEAGENNEEEGGEREEEKQEEEE